MTAGVNAQTWISGGENKKRVIEIRVRDEIAELRKIAMVTFHE